MSIRTLFYADGTTVYNATDFMESWDCLLENGVFGSLDFQVQPDYPADMAVEVLPGRLKKSISGNGYMVKSDDEVKVPITANTSGYNRIDLIVVEIDGINNVTQIKDIQGIPSSAPYAPDSLPNQVALAKVLVGNNASVIDGNVITDARTMAGPKITGIRSGTFTPSLKGSTTAGVFTYYSQDGQYIKIGNICVVQIKVEINQITTPAAGNLMLVGLPQGDANVAVPFTQISGKIAGNSFSGAVNTNHGAIYQPNVTGYVDASTLKSTDGFTCTLVYRC